MTITSKKMETTVSKTTEEKKETKHKRPVKKKPRKKAVTSKEAKEKTKKARPSKKKREAKKKDPVINEATDETPMLIAENTINKSIAECDSKISESSAKKKKTKKRKRTQTGEFVVVWTLPEEFQPIKGKSYKDFSPEKKEKLKKQFLDETKLLKQAGENIRLNGSKRDVARGTALKTHGGLLQTQLLVETRIVKRRNDDKKTITRTVIVSKEKSLNAKTSINSVYLKLWRKLIRKYMSEKNIPFFIPSKKSEDPKKKELYNLIIVDYSKQKAIVAEYLKETDAKEQTIEKAIDFYNGHKDSIVKMEFTATKTKKKPQQKKKKTKKTKKTTKKVVAVKPNANVAVVAN